MRRVLGLGAFLAVWAAVISITHAYFLLHLVLRPELPEPWATPLLAAIVVGGLGLFLRPLLEHRLGHRVLRVLSWPIFTWMGFAFLFLMLFIVSDLLFAAGSLAGVRPPGPAVQAAWVLGGVLALGAAGAALALGPPAIRRLDVEIPAWPIGLDGFRFVQISDVHIGPLRGRRFAGALARRVGGLDADLIAVTGDLVDGSVALLAPEVAPLRALRAPHGVWFVPGNHEHFSHAESWVEHLSGTIGFQVLRNERRTIGNGAGKFHLAGLDDRLAFLAGGNSREDLPRALDGRDPALPLVLLAHNPKIFDEAAAAGVALQLSGHTHGGQIWPFGAVVRATIGYVAGHYRKGEAQLYVSRGTGFWGPPLRLFARPEITEIVVRGTRAAGREEIAS